MDLKELLEHFNNGDTIGEDWAVIEQMRFHSREARKITLEINTKYHEPDELAALFSELIGEPVGENFGLFPPFYTDFGIRQEHPHRQSGVHQCGLQVPGPGRHLHR